jgi:hypothetical protein
MTAVGQERRIWAFLGTSVYCFLAAIRILNGKSVLDKGVLK